LSRHVYLMYRGYCPVELCPDTISIIIATFESRLWCGLGLKSSLISHWWVRRAHYFGLFLHCFHQCARSHCHRCVRHTYKSHYSQLHYTYVQLKVAKVYTIYRGQHTHRHTHTHTNTAMMSSVRLNLYSNNHLKWRFVLISLSTHQNGQETRFVAHGVAW